MIYYTRATHNFNNITREWEFIEEFADHPPVMKSCLGVHALKNGSWMNLREIIDENRKYYDQYKNDPFSGLCKDWFSIDAIKQDLLLLEDLKMIKSKIL